MAGKMKGQTLGEALKDAMDANAKGEDYEVPEPEDETTGGADDEGGAGGEDRSKEAGTATDDAGAGDGGSEDGGAGEGGAGDAGGDAGEPGDTGAGKDAGKEKAGGEEDSGKLSDEDLAPPEGLSKRAHERFEKLSAGYKEATGKIEELSAQTEELTQTVDAFTGMIRDSDLEPEEVLNTLQLGKAMKHAINGSDPDLAGRVLDSLKPMITHLETISGKSVAGGAPPSLIEQHEDLKGIREKLNSDHDDGVIDDEYYKQQMGILEETARGRAQAASRERQSQLAAEREQRENSERETSAARQQAIESAQTQLDQRGAELAKSDPGFKQKWDMMQKMGVPGMIAQLPPEQWLAKFNEAYKAAGDNIKTTVGKRRQNPLTSHAGARNVQPAKAKNMSEALSLAYEEMQE